MSVPGENMFIDRSYWVIPGKFLAGSFPGDSDPAAETAKLSNLLDHGIRSFINLMEIDEVNQYGVKLSSYEFQLYSLASERGIVVSYRHFPILDLSIPSAQQMRMILDSIDASLAAGKGVFLHCKSGVGRTGTVVGCFLARHGLVQGDQVLDRLHNLRNENQVGIIHVPETHAQRSMVISWREGE